MEQVVPVLVLTQVVVVDVVAVVPVQTGSAMRKTFMAEVAEVDVVDLVVVVDMVVGMAARLVLRHLLGMVGTRRVVHSRRIRLLHGDGLDAVRVVRRADNSLLNNLHP